MQTLIQRSVIAAALAGSEVAKEIVQSVDNGDQYSITNPINWPISSMYGVKYRLHDRQFPQVDHGDTVVYFDNAATLLRWLEDKREWIKSTDYDFSMHYSVYIWDWGPVFKYSKSM